MVNSSETNCRYCKYYWDDVKYCDKRKIMIQWDEIGNYSDCFFYDEKEFDILKSCDERRKLFW